MPPHTVIEKVDAGEYDVPDVSIMDILRAWSVAVQQLEINPCHAEWIKMPRPLLISSQSDYLIRIFDRNSHI